MSRKQTRRTPDIPGTLPIERLRTDGVTFHYQVKERLREWIEGGVWKPGEQIPTEKQLCEWFGVSRTVIRQALQALVDAGLLEKYRGKGTFVSKGKLEQPLASVYSLYQLLVSKGIEPATKFLQFTQVQPSRRVAEQLKLTVNDPVWRLDRLRLADGVPIVLDKMWLPANVWVDFDPQLTQHRSLYDVLLDRYQRKVVRAQEVLEPIILDEQEAELLGCRPGQPAFLVERTAFDETDTPVEYTKSITRGDRMRLTIDLKSPPGPSRP